MAAIQEQVSSTVLRAEPRRVETGFGGAFRALDGSKWILATAMAFGALSGVLLDAYLPSYYRAQAKLAILPLDDPVASGGVNATEGAAVALPVLSAVLTSTEVATETVRRLDLVRAWHVKSTDDAVAELLRRVSVITERRANNNLITIRVEDKDPVRARDIARTLATLGNERNLDIFSARARDHRRRLEARLTDVRGELTSAEDALRKFREDKHVFDFAEQAKITVAQAASLQGERIHKSLAVDYARGYGSLESPEVRQASRERAATEGQIERLAHASAVQPPLLPMDLLPALEVESTRLKRAVDIASDRYGLLARQVEELRAAEGRASGCAALVDSPTVPRHRTRPSRGVTAAACAIAALLLAALYALARPSRRS